MPVYLLNESPVFPHPDNATDEGLLAVGGDLSIERITEAYRKGIFPWYNNDDPVLWWSPDPRLVLFPEKLKVSKSLHKLISANKFHVSFDTEFENTIHHCASVKRINEEGTWITKEMKQAYVNLHRAGLAHSVEAYLDGKLAGGLYGVSIGRAFFGESMFHLIRDASKVALYYLAAKCKVLGIHFIDCQVSTSHLVSFGAIEIDRAEYLKILNKAVNNESENAWK